MPTTVNSPPQQPELVANMVSTLRELATRDAGPALSEFNLQLDAVRELVPDPATRLRIALSVLAKKGISREALEQDLERTSALFSQQLSSFSAKVEVRQREHQGELDGVQAAYDEARQKCEIEIAAHEAALVAQRDALTKAGAERERRLAELESSQAGLAHKERAFRAAHARIQAEYQNLSRELRGLLGEKS